jgi:hypothetical protein
VLCAFILMSHFTWAVLLPRLGGAAHRQRHRRKFFAPSDADRALAEAFE